MNDSKSNVNEEETLDVSMESLDKAIEEINKAVEEINKGVSAMFKINDSIAKDCPNWEEMITRHMETGEAHEG
tara:strand:+ start:918 stop:1136 length:219 start_codon:yes stop_codon:yes gene_type:complete